MFYGNHHAILSTESDDRQSLAKTVRHTFRRTAVRQNLPAFREGIQQQKAEVQAILDNPEAPTFANTIEAMEKSGQLLNQVSYLFFNLREANTNDSLNAIAEEIMPEITAHSDGINLNEQLFARIKTVYDNQDKENLTTEQKMVLQKYYNNFVRGGANLSPTDKETLKKINGELALLSLKFGTNQLKETNDYQLVIEAEKDLSGLPEGVIAAAAETAREKGMEGKWIFTLHNPSIMPFLQYADNRKLREEIYKAYINRGSRDNKNNNWEIISQMVSLRVQKAKLLGFPDYASYVLDDNMAKTPENVYQLCNQIWDAALPISKQEAAELQKMIDRSGEKFQLAPWDWRYYAEKLKKEKYGLNETESVNTSRLKRYAKAPSSWPINYTVSSSNSCPIFRFRIRMRWLSKSKMLPASTSEYTTPTIFRGPAKAAVPGWTPTVRSPNC